jgi:hypothetical protein
MLNDPIVLRAEDTAEDLPDPSAAGVALMELLRDAGEAAEAIRGLVANWYRDPAKSQRRALEEAVDLVATTARAIEAGEALMRSRRTAGELSHAYRGGR